MKSKVLCQPTTNEKTSVPTNATSVRRVDLAFASIFRTQEEDEEKDGGESRHKSKSEQRLVGDSL